MYGITIKYTMPSLTASPVIPDSELSSAARHMAHCAEADIGIKNNAIADNFNLVDIVWGDHQINNNAGNRDI